MKTFLLTATLILTTYAQARPYICPHVDDDRYQCVQLTAVQAETPVDTTLYSERVTKNVFDRLIQYEKSLSQRLIYSSKERIANPIQRVVIVGKRLPKAKKPVEAVAVQDDSRFLAFVRAAKVCLETDSNGVALDSSEGCKAVRANAMQFTLQAYAVMKKQSLQQIVDSINVNPSSQDELVKVLSEDDKLNQSSWEAQYQNAQPARRSKVSKFEGDLEYNPGTGAYRSRQFPGHEF